jgi:hypothetical protein
MQKAEREAKANKEASAAGMSTAHPVHADPDNPGPDENPSSEKASVAMTPLAPRHLFLALDKMDHEGKLFPARPRKCTFLQRRFF